MTFHTISCTVGYLYIFFGGMSVQVLDPFVNQVVKKAQATKAKIKNVGHVGLHQAETLLHGQGDKTME